MKFKTVTGAIIEPKSQEVADQLLEAGYAVVNEEASKVKAVKKAADKKDEE